MTQALTRTEEKVEQLLETNRDKVTALLAQELDYPRFLRVCVRACASTPRLRECSVASLIEACLEAGTVGLEPNTPTQEAFLIPYKKRARFQMGYPGYLTLAARNGIFMVGLDWIAENDHYEIHRGTRNELIHQVTLTDRGLPIAYYCIHQLPNGARDFTVMTQDEVDAVKAVTVYSEDKDSPWQKWPNQMALKSVILRDMRKIPGKGEKLNLAIALDGARAAGVRPMVNITGKARVILPEEDEEVPAAKPRELPADDGDGLE